MFTLVLTMAGERSSTWTNLRERLASVAVGDGPVLATVQAEMREYLGTEKTIAYGLQTDGVRVEALSFVHSSMPFLVDARARFQAHVRDTPEFGNYNPIRPQVRQRNRLIVWTRRQVEEANLPIMRELYPALGLAARAQARVLLCDGDTMLAFLGAWQPDPFDHEQQRRFRALVPLLQERLALERSAADSLRAAESSLLDAALEAIPRPVLVVRADGRVREANGLAVGVLAARAETVTNGVRELLRGGALPPGWNVTRVEQRGGGLDFLVLLPAEPLRARGASMRALTVDWELTRRQADVLALLCEGRSNQSIAAVLDISSRTVEVHVGALFDKARVGARSELVAKVLSLV